MVDKISLKQLKEGLAEVLQKFKIGDRVVIDNSYGGIWAQLGGLTGTITQLRKDAFWTFDINLDHPQCLAETNAWNSSSDGGLTASLGYGGVFLVSEIQDPEIISQLNQGRGLNLRPFCTEEPVLTDVQARLDAINQLIEEHRAIHRKNLSRLVEIRKKYVDALPEVVAAEQLYQQAKREAERAQPRQQTVIGDALFQKESEAREAYRQLFEEKHQWANNHIAELKQENAEYAISSQQFYQFESQKLEEMEQVCRVYLGRRHGDLVSNGKEETDSDDFLNIPLRCQACGWSFVVRERKPPSGESHARPRN